MALLIFQGDLHSIGALAFATPPLFLKHCPQSLAEQKMRLLALFVYFLRKKKKSAYILCKCILYQLYITWTGILPSFFYRFPSNLHEVPEKNDCLNNLRTFAPLQLLLSFLFAVHFCAREYKPTSVSLLVFILFSLRLCWLSSILLHPFLIDFWPKHWDLSTWPLLEMIRQFYTELSLASLSRQKKWSVNKKTFSFLSFT